VIPVQKITVGRFVLERRLQVKNFGIHDYSEDKRYMCMCFKDEVRHGSDNICSR
jgi:hypothetical protein